jgi:uncharacterized membrane protein
VFSEAFLLFFTNLVGIVLAATLTFYVLGYSGTLRSKRRLVVVAVVMLAISFPLQRSYTEIVQKHRIARALAKERYLDNGKYIMIRETSVSHNGGRLRLDLVLVVRSTLRRADLNLLREKLERRFGRRLDIHARLEYIL